MIRDLKFVDIHAVTSFLLDCHTRTIRVQNVSANIDVAETKRLIGAGIGRHGHKGPGGCWVQVAENEGRIDGLMYATLHRVYAIYDRLYATDLFWITNEFARPTDKSDLMENMLAWARSSPSVIEVVTVTLNRGDYVRTGNMLKRLGMQEYGAIHRLDFWDTIMFGSLVQGIGKIFTSIAGGVAKLGGAVRAVGASLFTASAATGTGLTSGLGNLFGGGGGSVLGNILGGAIKSGLTGALIGGIAGAATGQGFGKGAMIGGLGGAAIGGLSGAFTPTGMGVDPISTSSTDSALAGASTATGATPNTMASLAPIPDNMFSAAAGGAAGPVGSTIPGSSMFKGLGDFLKTPSGGQAIAGLAMGAGAGIGKYYETEALKKEAEKNRETVRKEQKRRTNSYHIDPSVLPGYTPDTTARPTPATAWTYDAGSGLVVRTA